MNARFAVIGAVSILALGVFLLTLLFDSPAPDEKPRPRPKPVAPTWTTQADAPSDQPVLGATRDFAADYLTSKGQLVRIFADQFQPLPQGRAQAKRPRAHIYLAPHRVLTIQAERGRFDVPENQPRGGDFEGEVILTLLEAPEDQSPNLSPAPNNPHRKLQVFLDSVRFDLELGQIDSDQPLRLVAQSVEFQGVGLSMTYNERRKRIERLEVLQAGQLHLDRTALVAPANSNNDDNNTPTNARTPKQTESIPDTQTPAPQLYTVRCQDNVILTADAGSIHADELHLLLTLEADDTTLLGQGQRTWPQRVPGAEALRDTAQRPGPQYVTASTPAPLPAHLATFAIAQSNTQPQSPTAQAQRVEVQWSGRMILEPLDLPADSPPQYTTQVLPDKETLVAVRNGAVFATLRGRPLTIHTPDNDRITAATLTFLSSSSQITLNGTQTIALEIDSPSRGVVIASETLHIDQAKQAVSLTGPGSLRSRPTPTDSARNSNARSKSALPLGLTIHWTEKVDLALTARNEKDSTLKPTTPADQDLFISQLAGLQSAAFQGQVRLRLPDPQVELDANTLTIPLVTNDDNNDQPTRLTAKGNARLKIKNNERQQSLALQADDLSLFLQGDLTGDFHPTELLAQGHVIATDHEQTTLNADNLQAIFKQPSNQSDPDSTREDAPPTNPTATPQAQPAQLATQNPDALKTDGDNEDILSIETDITSVIAQGHVHVDMPSRNVTVAADRLHAQPADDLITLEGHDADNPATVHHTDGSLTASTILLRPDAAIMETPGPGRTTFATAGQDDKNNNADTQPPAADAMSVAWTDHMRFDQAQGQATFQGDVQTHAQSGRNETNLATPKLTITFSPQALESSTANPTSKTNTGNKDGDVINAVRAVRQILAEGDSTLFATQTWADDPGGKLASRLRLGGTTLRFDQRDEKLHVDGAGWMQIEDYRPPASNDNAPNNNASALTPQVAFGGRGATLFEWTRGLTIDAAHNDVSMFGNVVMLHRPADQADVMQLNADSLAADMQATGGLDIWLKDNPPTPRLIAVRAAGTDAINRVRLISGQREVRTDKLTYLASDESILLEAQDGRYTYIIDTGRATSYPAQAIRWDLQQKKITVVNQGAVRSAIGAATPNP